MKAQNLQQMTQEEITENLNYMTPITFSSSPDWSKQAKQEDPMTKRSNPDSFFIYGLW